MAGSVGLRVAGGSRVSVVVVIRRAAGRSGVRTLAGMGAYQALSERTKRKPRLNNVLDDSAELDIILVVTSYKTLSEGRERDSRTANAYPRSAEGANAG